MARERSPERDKAKQMWLESSGTMKLKDIAAALSIGETQVRKWKSQDKWGASLNGNVTNESNVNVTNRGAPKGNKNAIGNRGGAPPGNQNAKGNSGGAGGPLGNKKAVTTGEHETIWMDTLTEAEQQLMDHIDTDPVAQADEAIALLSVRERRMMQRIRDLMEGLSEKERSELQELKSIKGMGTVHDEKSGITKSIPVSRDEMVLSKVEEKTFRKLDDILKLEEALTRIQDKKIRAIRLKYEISGDEQRLRIDKLRGEVRRLGITDTKEPLHIVIDYGDDA